ncbi:hypothetical protein HY493_04195 [Candidatus Woesearchaeota archaeon]|nr:hypothetical protein [Candidatus Woesearchaeota archaeon]
MNKALLALLTIAILVLAGCQYLKPALAPNTDCSSGIVDETEKAVNKTLTPVTGAVTKTETQRDGVPVKTVKEGELVSFPNLKATDPDGDKLTYTFTSPLNAKGEWQTKPGDAGEYKVVITATDGKATTKQEVIIKVVAGNKAPTIELSDVKVKEGEQVTLAPKVSDPEGDKVTTSYSGWMTTNTKKTTFDDAGTYNVTVTADDGKSKTTKTIKVTVENVNRAPVILQLQDIGAKEGDKIEIFPKVTDADNDKVTLTFTAPFDADGVWQTKKGDEGVKKVTVTADDGKGGKATMSFLVAVESTNSAPVIGGGTEFKAKEGESIDLSKSFPVTDADKDSVTVTYSGWMTTATKTLAYGDAGSHDVTITAKDKEDTVTKNIKIVVEDVNRAPTFDSGSFS